MNQTPPMDSLPCGSITDVPGVLVGHHERLGRGWQTGTTVVVVPGGATPGVDVRGGGPGTRETDALAPANLVQTVHGVCLTGGSAYGLAAAGGVMTWLERRGLGVPVGPEPAHVVPVVPAAVIFDLGRGGRFDHRPDAGFGERAAGRATNHQQRWGAVGAGAGARAGGLQGGVGTASTTVTVPGATETADGRTGPAVDVVVGAVAVVNANGEVIDPARGLPWYKGALVLRRPPAGERAALRTASDVARSPALNTTIGVVATSARLDKAETGKVASVAHDGLARAIRPAHSMIDGDTIFGLATGLVELPGGEAGIRPGATRAAALNLVLQAAAEVFATACSHAIVAARSVGDAPAYRDLCPTAVPC